MSKNNSSNLLIALFVLCVAVVSCKSIREGKPAADAAVITFHSLLDQGRYADIYAASDSRMKDAATENDLSKLLNAVHTKLGNVKESTAQSFNVGNYNLTTTVTVVQQTTFERGKATEQFVFVIDGKNAALAGYNINSADLITN
jgi:hypothetical protein